MSDLQVRNDLLQGVIDNAGVGIAFENSAFNSKQGGSLGDSNDAFLITVDGEQLSVDDVSCFVACYYLPATVESLGKTKPSADDYRGVFQVSIFVRANSDEYDNKQLEIADRLRSAFYIGSTFGAAFIESAELGGGGTESGWYMRPLSINYMSYQTR